MGGVETLWWERIPRRSRFAFCGLTFFRHTGCVELKAWFRVVESLSSGLLYLSANLVSKGVRMWFSLLSGFGFVALSSVILVICSLLGWIYHWRAEGDIEY